MVHEHEPDGIEDALGNHTRIIMTTIAQVGTDLARQREAALARQVQEQQRAVRAEHERLDALRAAGRAELAPVHSPEWWDRSTAEQVGRAWAIATTWEREDPSAAAAATRLQEEARRRYGVDLRQLPTVDPREVGNQLDRGLDTLAERHEAQRLLNEAREERGDAATSETDADHMQGEAREERELRDTAPHRHEAAEHGVRADDRQDEAEAKGDKAEHAYDSAERREALAGELQRRGIEPELVTTRVRTDLSNGQPPVAAVTHGRRGTARPRRRRGFDTGRDLGRGC